MPAIKKITKEIILSACKEIIEKEGDDKLNARYIARHLKCTTQPIYDEFKNMRELKLELSNYIRNFYYSFINKNIHTFNDNNMYLKYVKSYLKFSHLYPNLYKFIFLNSKYQDSESDKQFNENIIKMIQEKGNYSYKVASDFFLLTWFISLGLSTIMTNKNFDYDIDEVNLLLEKSFLAFKNYFEGK